MRVLLVRHGDALPARDSDETRILSVRGREQTRALGGELVAKKLAPSRIVSSPLVRAVQTAEILAASLGWTETVESDPALVPEGDPWRAESMFGSASGLVIAVTHEPIIRVIAARLVQQASFPAFRTSAAVMIEDGRVALKIDPAAG
jgi:phosphohistidine phosphatase